MDIRLYVGNLAYEVTNEALHASFGRFGTVNEAHVVKDRETGRGCGFGFVTMNSAEGATRATARLNDSMFEGRLIRVNLADGVGGQCSR